jgi:phage-related protein (TIGR01555 family)
MPIKKSVITKAKQCSKSYPIKPPQILPNIIPKNRMAPVLAEDAANFYNMFDGNSSVQGFPGYQYLALLASRAEYINLASTMSQELTRKWIELCSTDSGKSEKIKALTKRMVDLGVQSKFATAARHDCYFGRAQFYLDLKNHDRKLPLILSPKTIAKNSLKNIAVVEAMWTTPSAYNALDPAQKDFYTPTGWFVLGKETHASRLLTIITRPVPDMLKPAFNFSGMSLSQMAEPYVENWLRTRQSVSDLIYNFSLTSLATDMNTVLDGTSTGDDLFTRLDLFQANRTNLGMMVLDKGREELSQINTPLSGLHELQAQSQEHICSVSRIPSMLYTGISPTGMNASSEGELRAFYDWIGSIQQAYWSEPLSIILKVIQLDMFGEIDPDITFKWLPLYQMNDEQKANIRKINCDVDCAYIDHGVIDQEQVGNRLAADSDYDDL